MSSDPANQDDTLPLDQGKAVPASQPTPSHVNLDAATLSIPVSSAPRLTTQQGQDDKTIAPESTHYSTDGNVVGYEILAELGRGGMGVVYKARQTKLKRLVALKMILAAGHAGAKECARFRLEAETIASLQHPNIIQIYEVGEQKDFPFFSMELIEGTTLGEKLNGLPQPGRLAAHLMEILARTIHFAHQHNIVHRDLKPGNILLSNVSNESQALDADAREVQRVYGSPKIMDFGLAKHLDSEAGQTRTGDLLGTPSYMSPEQASGKTREIGPASDIYALGAIFYEMLTGRPPFRTANTLDTLWEVMNTEPKSPSTLQSGVAGDLERICLKCLEKDPQRRYATALELADDLRRHLNGEPVHARPAGPLKRLTLWCRRNPLPTCLLIAITLGSAFGLWEMSLLSDTLVRQSAIESAKHQSEMMDEVNHFYANLLQDIIVKKHGKKDRQLIDELPAPATVTIDLGKQISSRSKMGVHMRLYSDHPFPQRKKKGDWGPHDDFEREALTHLHQKPTVPYYRFEEYKGRMSLRYATARLMTKECLSCHNKPEYSKHDWKEGDLRGVLEIIRPLDIDVQNVRTGLRGTFILTSTVGIALLLGSALVLYLLNRRRSFF